MVSTQDANKFVYVTSKIGWAKTKVYADGRLIREFKNSSEFKNGIKLQVEDFGTIAISLAANGKLKLSVDEISFEPVISKKEAINNFRGAAAIFVVLASFNFLFLFGIVFITVDAPDSIRNAAMTLIALAIACITIYTLSAIYLRKRVYAFYFIGTSVFLLTTLYFTNSYVDHDGEFFLWYTLPRLVILALLLRYFNRVLRLARNYQEKNHDDVLDDNLLTPHFQ